jgi:hypothetical protein
MLMLPDWCRACVRLPVHTESETYCLHATGFPGAHHNSFTCTVRTAPYVVADPPELVCRHGRRSWRPWVGSLCLELLSTYFTRRGKQLMREAAAQQGSSPSLAQQSGPTAAAVAASAAVKAMRGGAGPGLGPGATVAAAAGGPTSLLSLALVRWVRIEEVLPVFLREGSLGLQLCIPCLLLAATGGGSAFLDSLSLPTCKATGTCTAGHCGS